MIFDLKGREITCLRKGKEWWRVVICKQKLYKYNITICEEKRVRHYDSTTSHSYRPSLSLYSLKAMFMVENFVNDRNE